MKITAYNQEHNVDLSGGVKVTATSYAKTSLGSNTPLVESGAGAPGSGPQAAAWDHVHPAAAGGSFGSNSTRVAAASAAGASTSSSRADHVHDGIGTVTASSSNTLNRGNLNLRAGTGIALALSNTDGGSGLDTVTITNIASGSGGGSVSYGSNANRVAAVSAAGASTLVSRADHVHDGIGTITASSSNTLARGTFNIRAGNSIAIGWTDSDGDGLLDTATFNSTASGGGGGGGGSGNISAASAVTVDYGKIQLLTVRATANTEDDDFDAGSGSLNAKWLTYTGYDMSYSLSTMPGWLRSTSAGAKLQTMPAGDWTIECEVVLGDIGAAAFQNDGLILTSGTTQSSASEARWYIGQANSLQSYRFTFEKFVNGAFSSTYSNWDTRPPGPTSHYFLRINKSSTTYTAEYSAVGSLLGGTAAGWQRFFQVGLGFTPTHIGLVSGGSGTLFNYFRRY